MEIEKHRANNSRLKRLVLGLLGFVYGAAVIPASFMALLSPMMSDSPHSGSLVLLPMMIVILLPVFLIIASITLLGVAFHDKELSRSGVIEASLPLIDVAVLVVTLLLLNVVCVRILSCS